MSIRAAIHHLTHYKYDRPVSLGPQIIRLRPAPHSRTRVISHSLKVSPANHFVNHQQDPYGNWLARYVFPELVDELKIEVDVVADMTVYNRLISSSRRAPRLGRSNTPRTSGPISLSTARPSTPDPGFRPS